MVKHTPCGRKIRRKMPLQFILSASSHRRDHAPLCNHFLRKSLQVGEGGFRLGASVGVLKWESSSYAGGAEREQGRGKVARRSPFQQELFHTSKVRSKSWLMKEKNANACRAISGVLTASSQLLVYFGAHETRFRGVNCLHEGSQLTR